MILDTNAISAMSSEDREIEVAIHEATQLYLSVPVLAEYQYGLINSRYQKLLGAWLEQLKTSWPVLTLDLMTAHCYAEIRNQLQRKGRVIPVNDLWIGALAIQHQLPILSEDRHFDYIDGIKRIGWKKK